MSSLAMPGLLQSLVPALGWALLNFVWQGLILGLLAWPTLALLRQAGPRWRYAVCAWSLLICLGLPLAHLAWMLSGEAGSRMPSPVGALPAWLQAVATHLPALVTAWSFGVMLMALRLGVGLAWLGRLRRRAGPAPQAWQQRLDALALRLGLCRKVTLGLLPDLSSPITLGLLRPLVLLPTALLSGMPPPLLEALLAHELAHVRRWDYLANLLQSLVESLLFFHPVVWWLSGQMRDAREEVADELAAQALDDPRRMATALHELSLQQAGFAPRLAMSASGGKLLQRLERLLAPQAQTAGWKIALPALLVAATSLWMQTQPSLGANGRTGQPAPVSASLPSLPSMPQLLQLPVNARHMLLLDESSGAVLMAKDADAAVPIASITKLMTAMVALDARQDLDEQLRIEAGDLSARKPSAAHLAIGASISRLSALKLTLMPSDNRAAATLARNYAGGTPAFVQAMQAKAHSLGLTNTRFVDPAGILAGNVSSAAEVAKIAAAAARYPEIARISSEQSARVGVDGHARAVRNTNPLVGDLGWDIKLSKTGYTGAAGSCLTMRINSGGKPFTLVLLNADDSAQRQLDATRIRDRLASLRSS
ncbi:M56 family metallopeptidase [Roseateles oligotrophus]|uniref:M56 family metallopeptidase n=1 Tax=Roseateles oligotrophus TaxID=1769250 RepID=A0ABT2YF55_9BURK|nr:M56 family metallopeptidase [Roseateles oligotrophus]MCV2368659.1 M56 family metallopeptidase [Roseateles oligotrophus]